MTGKDSFENISFSESCKAIDWSIDILGQLRIYDDVGKRTASGLVVNSTKTNGDTGLFVLLQNLEFDDPSYLRTLNLSLSEALPRLGETLCLIFSFNRQDHEICLCTDSIFADHIQMANLVKHRDVAF